MLSGGKKLWIKSLTIQDFIYVLLSFCRGFHDVIPFDAISQFDEGGLELLLGGIGTINVKDWRDNTVYKNYQPSDTVGNFPGNATACNLPFR